MFSISLSSVGLFWCSHVSLVFWDDMPAVGEDSNHNRQFELQTAKSYLVTNTLHSLPALWVKGQGGLSNIDSYKDNGHRDTEEEGTYILYPVKSLDQLTAFTLVGQKL